MIRTLLVPLDGSAASERVLPLAQEIAGKSSASIVLTTIVASGFEDLEPLYRSYLEHTRERLAIQAGNRNAAATKSDVHLLKGSPADEILCYADELNADLIMMASRGATGGGPWLLGSVVTRVTVASTKPVLVVKSDDVKPGTDKRKLFQRILVPLDGSPAGESALVFTEELAAIMGSELILFHAVQPAASWMDAGIGGTYAAIEVPESVKSAAKRYMEDVQKRLLGKGLKTKIVLRDGPAAELIIEYAKNEGVDAISISTHGRTGINRWVFGSVTEKILRYGPSSVLVIRAAKGSA